MTIDLQELADVRVWEEERESVVRPPCKGWLDVPFVAAGKTTDLGEGTASYFVHVTSV